VSWLPATAPGAHELDRVFGLRPDLYEPYRSFSSLFWHRCLVDPVVLDLCRLRVAMLLGCERERRLRTRPACDAGLSEAQVAALPAWTTAPDFTAAQRDAIGFAEQFVIDPTGITDEDRTRVRAHVNESGFVALVEALALFEGFMRFQLILDVAPDGDEPALVDPPAPETQPGTAGADDGDAVANSPLAVQPETLRAFQRFYGTLWSHGEVPQSLKETARLRNARVTGCNYCKAVRFAGATRDGLSEEQIARIDDDYVRSDLSDAQKTVLRFTDAFLTDPGRLPTAVRAELVRIFTPGQIVELAAGVALFLGFSKIAVSMADIPELPVMTVPTPDWRPA
jgi:AhpD family alkylhydroperoxidase